MNARITYMSAVAALWMSPGALAQAQDDGVQGPALPLPEVTQLGTAGPPPIGPDKEMPPSPSRRLGLQLADVPEVRLGPIDLARILAEDDARAQQDKVYRYGVARNINVTMASGAWLEIPNAGRLWAVDVVAEQAVGIRLHLEQMQLPPGAEVAVYAVKDPQRLAGPYEGTGPFDDGQVWTPTRFDERVRVEYFEPPLKQGFQVPDNRFVITQIQHIYRDSIFAPGPVAKAGDDGGIAGSTCINPVSCFFPTWQSTSAACAGIGTISPDSLFCSGTMLNATNGDLTPYWLTANHCLSTNGAAQASEIYWFYQRATCGGAVPSLSSVPQSAVCTLLSTGVPSDYTLLMIEGALPTGMFWAGWTNGAVPTGESSAGIHHPQGTEKRISFGAKLAGPTCWSPGTSAGHLGIGWSQNATEPGSSGSGIFRTSDQALYGQLHCGASFCPNGITTDSYGAFATTYASGSVASLLAGGSDDPQEQNDTCAAIAGNNSFPPGVYNGLIVKRNDQDWYKVSLGTGQQVTVNLSFTHAWGDVDVVLTDGCGGPTVAGSTGVINTESFSYTNTGAPRNFFINVYLYQGGSFPDTRNGYNMTISQTSAPVPANNVCAAATPIVAGSYQVGNLGATTDGPGEWCISGLSDVWYLYTAPRTGTTRVSLCGAKYDSTVAIYDACPSVGGTTLGCNDDYGSCGLGSEIMFPCTGGAQYRIRLAGFGGAQGVSIMNVTCNPATTQTCATIAAPINNGTFAFSTIGATTDGPLESLCTNQPNQDIWYEYRAPCNGTVRLNLCASSYDCVVAVYSGNCPVAANTAIACNDDTPGCGPFGLQSFTTFAATQGSVYRIRIGGFSSNTGTGSINIRCGCAADCAPAPNGDGAVNVLDLLAVINRWGLPGGSTDMVPNGTTDVSDLLFVINNWGLCP